MKDRKLRFTEEGLQYKRGFRWLTVAYADIEQAYMRVEAVNAKLGRGTANFDMHFLMLKTKDGSLLKLGVFPKTTVKKGLDLLKWYNEDITIGFYQEKEEESAGDEE